MRSIQVNTPHPAVSMLALYSGGEMPWTERWRLRRHIRHCAECEQQLARFRSAREHLRHDAGSETLTAFEAIGDWNRLEREMLGNIAVGVAAARCVDKVGRGRAVLSRIAIATGLLGLVVAGWVTHVPKEQTRHLFASLQRLVGTDRPQQVAGTVVRTLPDGIAVRTQGATLMIMHPQTAVVSLSGPSAVAARYVDEETGQVTIANVYGQ
jgi:hypothetical protein